MLFWTILQLKNLFEVLLFIKMIEAGISRIISPLRGISESFELPFLRSRTCFELFFLIMVRSFSCHDPRMSCSVSYSCSIFGTWMPYYHLKWPYACLVLCCDSRTRKDRDSELVLLSGLSLTFISLDSQLEEIFLPCSKAITMFLGGHVWVCLLTWLCICAKVLEFWAFWLGSIKCFLFVILTNLAQVFGSMSPSRSLIL